MVMSLFLEEAVLAPGASALAAPVQDQTRPLAEYLEELTVALTQPVESAEAQSAEVQDDWAWMMGLVQMRPPTEAQEAAYPRATS